MKFEYEGFLNVLKPPGMTSHDVVGYLRRLLSMKKIGHTGTLDPNASGVLPVCLGRATRLSSYASDQNKGYRAEMTLGWSTDTQDAWGSVLQKHPADWVQKQVSKERVLSVMKDMTGPQLQTPPMISAVKVGGRKLYEWAREGKEITRESRQVVIHSLQLVDMYADKSGYPCILFDVECSKGTYIRSLCAEMGERLNTGGHMSYLLRTFSGPFFLRDSLSLEEIARSAAKEELQSMLKDLDFVLQNRFTWFLDSDQSKDFQLGKSICLDAQSTCFDEILRVYGPDHDFIGLGQLSEGCLYPRKVFLKE